MNTICFYFSVLHQLHSLLVTYKDIQSGELSESAKATSLVNTAGAFELLPVQLFQYMYSFPQWVSLSINASLQNLKNTSVYLSNKSSQKSHL